MMRGLGRILVLVSILILNAFPAVSHSKDRIRGPLVMQNNQGHPSNDFRYILADGRKSHLYAIEAKYTLLFFYNLECDACKVYGEHLMVSKMINDRIKKEMLKVLAIYIDKDVVIWKKHLPEMHNNWIHGRDENEYLFKNNVYDLHAIPTIYLLDRNKRWY